MNKGDLMRSAQETVEICKNGVYTTITGESIDLRHNIQETIANTKIFASSAALDRNVYNKSDKKEFKWKDKVIITDRTTNDAIEEWNRADNNRNITALNFASAKNPGGGFLNGMNTQEECIARKSTLYSSLVSAMAFYEYNRSHLNRGTYNNSGIYSPNIALIKNKGEQLIKPIYVDIITCPAVNRRAALRNKVADEKITGYMSSRIELIFKAYMKYIKKNNIEKSTLILGAFGCGVFMNKPDVVAGIFRDKINQYWEEIQAGDIRIDFAIPGGKNLDIFKVELLK